MNPEKFTTLIEMLAIRANISADATAFTFNRQSVSFAELWLGINRFAAFLMERNINQGERVVLALPNGPEFFSAFYGIQQAGGVAVPVFPGAGPERILSLANLCAARIIVLPSNLSAEKPELPRRLAGEHPFELVTVSESAGTSLTAKFPEISPDDVAFIQYTSGSTGNPKGVMLTHANLLTNIRQMIAGMEITAGEIFVSWLPVYHDMGLILKTMLPFYLAARVHLLPTNLRNVGPWLDAIQNYRATFTAAPDFAYRLCLHHIDPGGYDLSSLRVALNAAEPVRAKTLRDFEQAFGLNKVMVAGYGLAEATVGVSMWKPGTQNRVDPHGRVSVGTPFPDVDLLIVSDGKVLPPGAIGEIAIRSKANTKGYFNNPDETQKLFWKDGFLLSGDLGYLDGDGYLYFISRAKNIIKRSGETISPQEIEEVVDGMSGVRFSAAIGVDKGGIEGEQVYIFAEIRDKISKSEYHEMALQIVADFHGQMGFRPARVYLLEPRSIPLTHNGKIQHTRLREMYLDGSLKAGGSIRYPGY